MQFTLALHRARRFATKAVAATFLLSLPIGYYPEMTDSTKLYLGVHGGAGQVATVLRDCSGNPIASTTHTVSEMSAEGFLPVARSPVVVGLRGGVLHVEGAEASRGWINPSLNLEWRQVGIGFGWLTPAFPWKLGDLDADSLRFTAHVRFGNPGRFHFSASLGESSPMVSGGGLFSVGFGYPIGAHMLMFTALTAGFYDQPGFAQYARFRIARMLDLETSIRLGGAAGNVEGAGTLGLIYHWGRR